MTKTTIEALRALERRWQERSVMRCYDLAARSVYATVAHEMKAALAALSQGEAQQPEAVADEELPGMWSASDFTGGDPDERSHAERTTPTHDGGAEAWTMLERIRDDQTWRSNDNALWPDLCKLLAGRALTPATPQGGED